MRDLIILSDLESYESQEDLEFLEHRETQRLTVRINHYGTHRTLARDIPNHELATALSPGRHTQECARRLAMEIVHEIEVEAYCAPAPACAKCDCPAQYAIADLFFCSLHMDGLKLLFRSTSVRKHDSVPPLGWRNEKRRTPEESRHLMGVLRAAGLENNLAVNVSEEDEQRLLIWADKQMDDGERPNNQ